IIGHVTIIVGLMCLIIAVIASILVAKNFSTPIIELNNVLKEIGRGNFGIKINIKRPDEIGQLALGVGEMAHELRDLISRTSMAKLKQKEAEFKALQNQINPHFLYNTLESIQMKAVVNKQPEISDMTAALGKLIRLSISRGAEIVPIKQEIEHVGLYIKLQKIRYGDKLDCAIRFDEDIMELYSVKLILQPIVENSIYHGLEKKLAGGRIVLTGEIIEGDVIIKIQDNGAGMAAKKLMLIRRSMVGDGTYEAETTNIGVKNVHERIKLYFGEQYGLDIYSSKDVGTMVVIKIPANKDNTITTNNIHAVTFFNMLKIPLFNFF
ncbi:MAG: sensor histidine kinase, partial [Actinobacteria bacterium]|nr:sensor histidine kinase [Actinomycetota bacterium]